jgi:hypothetical protein
MSDARLYIDRAVAVLAGLAVAATIAVAWLA